MVIKMYGVLRRLDNLESLKSSRCVENDSEREKCAYLWKIVQNGEMNLTVMVPTMVHLTR